MKFKEYAGNPVLVTGSKGEWDAGALGTMSVLKVGDLFHMYYEAWGQRSGTQWVKEDYYSLQIGHATSRDGIHWIKDPKNPVLKKGAAGQWDHHGTWDPFVLYEDSLFKMWHGGGANDYCDWSYATSRDGSHFTKHGKISSLGNVEDIHIVHDRDSGKYHMYYWDRAREPIGLCHVVSPNETNFDFSNIETIEIKGETGMYKFTHVIQENDGWYMFYSNFVRPNCPDATIRLATSPNGSDWTAINRNLLPGQDGEILNIGDDQWLMYYGPRGYFDSKDCSINVAEYQGKLADLAEQGVALDADKRRK
ncbi:MAG TPA: hypothetical protein PKZ84_12330 [Anaerolineae bacterium]|nr:hypothetical protein [Anaerolineae bacterium]HQI85424.1 hypothetical protein [Anaerolineae bacterium]